MACFGVLPFGVTTIAGPAALLPALTTAVPAYVAGVWLLRRQLALSAFTTAREEH